MRLQVGCLDAIRLEVDQVRQMAQFEQEYLRLKKRVTELSLDETTLQDFPSQRLRSRRGVDRWSIS